MINHHRLARADPAQAAGLPAPLRAKAFTRLMRLRLMQITLRVSTGLSS